MLSERTTTRHRQKIFAFFVITIVLFLALFARILYMAFFESEYLSERARDLHERERAIKAARGRIIDRNGIVLADNRSVCTVSVIHNQLTDTELVVKVLTEELGISEEKVRKTVGKRTSREILARNIDKETGDRIRQYDLDGVKVDEDYRRYYPYGKLGGKVLGFTGADNQGILGLEAVYEQVLQGKSGKILTVTDAAGIEMENEGERRIEPVKGSDLHISIDANIQSYATQLAQTVLAAKDADSVQLLVMNPQNGEIYASVDVPEFDPNSPYELQYENAEELSAEEKQSQLNAIWRNRCINDTYEPGSIFKIITAAAGLEEGVITTDSSFHCPGYIVVDDRKIRCHKTTGHGSQDFTHCMMNSCNPALISVGLRLGVDTYYSYFEKFGLLSKTGVDLPGEAGTIMHKKDNMGNVELATVAFGQSFQITPIQLLTTVSSIINGGNRITPHFALYTTDDTDAVINTYEFPVRSEIVPEKISETMRKILEQVVSEGTGKNGKTEGYLVGGKTATSQTLPRSSGKYIASFLGFAPADDPQVIALVVIHNPQGTYYGGQVAAPVIRQLFENILPYLGIKEYNK